MSIPKWPDFEVERIGETVDEHGGATYAIRTDTGRPKTPVFQVWETLPTYCSDQERRMLAAFTLARLYEDAHPNGCPVRH